MTLPSCPALVARPLKQSRLHRSSFNAPAGPAPDGSTLADSLGGLSAVIRSGVANFPGCAIALPGGHSADAAYVDLPNGLISARENVSIEFGESPTAAHAWCRIISVGIHQMGEVDGPPILAADTAVVRGSHLPI